MTKQSIIFNGQKVGEFHSTGNKEKDQEIIKDYLIKEGLWKNSTHAKKVFGQANVFADVALQLYKDGFSKRPYDFSKTSPFIVNGMLGLELYLKALYYFYDQKPKRTHNVETLYENLPATTKDKLNRIAKDAINLHKVEAELSFKDHLSKHQNAFENWRYIYEISKQTADLDSLKFCMHVAGESCMRETGK